MPFLICVWAKESAELLFDAHCPDGSLVFSSSLPTLRMFFKEEDRPMTQVNSLERCADRGRKKRETKERGKRKNEDEVVCLLVNCGCVVLCSCVPYRQGGKSFFFSS